jgi:hypothetical protein
MVGDERHEEWAPDPGASRSLCRPESVHRPPECAIHAGGRTRKYTIQTSATFERSKDHKIVPKVMVTCEITVFGLGSHSATGEEWADYENAVTSAEAQAFKRACACLGLGSYL